MSEPTTTYRCMPTLDMYIDVHANSEDEALELMRKMSEEIVLKACTDLFNKGFHECGSDPDFVVDSWDYEQE